jgi:zinc/manganese transport system ATP-binding protein
MALALDPYSRNDVVLHHLTLGYERHPAVHHLNTTVPAGSLVAVVGPNGAGKSTLLKALAGLVPPCKGTSAGCAASAWPTCPNATTWTAAFPSP